MSRRQDDILAEAVRLHRRGSLGEAERLYLKVLAMDPGQADSLRLLGMIAYQDGRLDVAVDLIGKALASRPDFPEAYSSLGNVFRKRGRQEEAVSSFRKALALKPDYPEAHANLAHALMEQGRLDAAIAAYRTALDQRPNFLGVLVSLANACKVQGKLDEAIACYRQALKLNPHYPEAYCDLGNALIDRDQIDEGIACYRKPLELDPDFPDALSNLGGALKDRGLLEEAIACCRRALELRPAYPEACSNLGTALMDKGQVDEAVACFRKAIELKPDFPDALVNLGIALRVQNKFDEAVASCDRALILRPDYAEAHDTRGTALCAQGKLTEAVASHDRALAVKPVLTEAYYHRGCALLVMGKHYEALANYDQALVLKPDYADAYSSRLFVLHYLPDVSNVDILTNAKLFSKACEAGSNQPTFANSESPVRRLRIGYVSADLADHPVGYFMANILAAHDRRAVEVFCYHNRAVEDDMSDQLRRSADHWRRIAGVSDSQVAATVRQDQIDILVDLSGHTGHNRLLLFANRPAPVQVTWLGYFGTTGLLSMDYLLADRFVIADGEESCFTEKVVRLPDSYLCFSPPTMDCPIVAPPSMGGNAITFGNFNAHAKTSPSAIALWARILSAVPNSRLLLKTPALGDSLVQQSLIDQFNEHGIDKARLALEGFSPRRELLLAYNRVDVALDPTPYGGGTTTAEALWMGVPVVTLRGATWVGRVSESIVTTVGLPELVARSHDEYVNAAAQFATDLPRLVQLRSALRPQMQASAFCDANRFIRHLEQAYRRMWRDWCATQSTSAGAIS